MAGAAAGAAIGGGLMDLMGQGLGNIFAANQSRKARHFALMMYKNRYQYTMRDMEKAGLNPILAAGMGLGGGGSPTVSGASGFSSRPGGAALEGAKVGRLLEAQFDATQGQAAAQWAASARDAEAAKTTELSRPAVVRARNAEASTAEAEATMRKAEQDFYKTPAGQKARQIRILRENMPNSFGSAAATAAGGAVLKAMDAWDNRKE